MIVTACVKPKVLKYFNRTENKHTIKTKVKRRDNT
jgi:hypothetical protein